MKTYSLGEDARKAIKKVAKQVGNILGKTQGPGGRNYFIPTGITNDGKTIIRSMEYDNEIEQNVLMAFDEVAERADKEAGDGTTCSVVTATKLTEDVIDKVQDLDTPTPGAIPALTLSKNLEEEKNKVIELLESYKTPVEDKDTLYKVALTAMEDETGAQLVADAIWEAGKDTFPILHEGINGKIEKDVIDGASYPFSQNTVSGEFEDCDVVVVNHVFQDYMELSNFFQSLMEKGQKIRPLVIVANHFSTNILRKFSEVSARLRWAIIPISQKNIPNGLYEDLAAYTGARFMDTNPKGGESIENLLGTYRGHAKKVIVREKETIFIQGRGKETITPSGKSQVDERVVEIEKHMEATKKEDERTSMEKRIAALKGGITTIYVDAQTAAERYYLKLKTEDAMNSCRSALNEGVVKGGGETLNVIAQELGEDALMHNALKETSKNVQKNYGDTLVVGDDVLDSVAVLKSSIKNAVSVVKILITTEGIIADKNRDIAQEIKDKLFQE